jgi:hypothetical protein
VKALFAIFILSVSVTAAADVTCPLGANQNHLTIQQVMTNFGKYVGQADYIAMRGAKYPDQALAEADITDAAAGIVIAQNCAQAVIDKPEGDLLPSRTVFMDAATKKAYVDNFVYFMTDFRDALIKYHTDFAALAAQKPADRDWNALYQESTDLNNMIDHDHRKTAGDN